MSDRKNIIFDSQILNSVQLCGMRTDLMFNKDLKLHETSHFLEEGDLLHRMFEFYNLGLKEHGVEILYDNEKFKSHVEKSISHGERASLELGISPNDVSEVIFQFEKYVNHTRMDGVKILEVERAFIFELYQDDELGVYYTGKIDRLTDTPIFGSNVPRDYKSARRTEAPLSLSNQFTGYACATGSSVVIVDKVGFQKTLTPEDRFKSYPLYYTEYQIETWKQQTIWWGKQYAFYIETGTWPMNRTSCDKYSGCLFVPICSAATEEGREVIMNAEFVVGDKWDPTKYLNKKKEEVKI